MGIYEVQGRIAAIEARFTMGAGVAGGVLGSSATGSSISGSATSSSSNGLSASGTDSSFADALATLTGQKSSSSNGSSNINNLVNSLTGNNVATPTTGSQVIAEAKNYLGVPYMWGGESRKGMDCSGLTQTVFEKFGINLPRTSSQQARVGIAVKGLANAKPGDLLFFHSPVSHVGIYIGDGKMINSPHRGAQVRIEKVWSSLTSVRRVLPENSVAAGSAGLGSSPTNSVSDQLRVSAVPSAYAQLFVTAGAKHGISPNLLAAVAKIESNFNPHAVSSAGARGLMQFMPGTAAGLGINPLNPSQAVDGAARLLKSYLNKYDGSLPLALAAYNAGPGAVQRYHGVPPYAETQAYIRKVSAAMA